MIADAPNSEAILAKATADFLEAGSRIVPTLLVLDDLHAFDRDYAQFKRVVESQDRFKNVHVDYTLRKGGRIYLNGTVVTQEDHDALTHLVDVALKHAVSGYYDGVEVVAPDN